VHLGRTGTLSAPSHDEPKRSNEATNGKEIPNKKAEESDPQTGFFEAEKRPGKRNGDNYQCRIRLSNNFLNAWDQVFYTGVNQHFCISMFSSGEYEPRAASASIPRIHQYRQPVAVVSRDPERESPEH
jgi:hypothetical protein